ncbi:S-adenosylmethionine decarboxylase [Paenibacillus hamazuiensis]|uniref:S-adenosylmethionine decarboxylase n=1 Tax=Paenibacillus hamazuiensis TaxID=2936508 RepID=UPI00200C0CBE|nr:S-adenosylmethionine decarboxylase [Paenibacillus hamazuiensis]
MGKRRTRKLWMYVLLALFIVWPVYHITEMLGGGEGKQDATKLLYQVSLFQMELLGGFLNDAAGAQNTSALNEMKQVLYSAQYAHEHLVLAVGEKELSALPSLNQLLQYVTRLQIGGQRPLKSEEVQTLQEVHKQFAELYDAYSKLMSSGDEIIGSQNKRLEKADKAIGEAIRKRSP